MLAPQIAKGVGVDAARAAAWVEVVNAARVYAPLITSAGRLTSGTRIALAADHWR
jgi:hypothetical protein